MAIGAIKTYQGQYKEIEDMDSLEDAVKVQREIEKAAAFLQISGKNILRGDKELFGELSKLRFWHVGRYVQQWGKGVIMDRDDIAENGLLVPRIIELLKPA